MTSTYRTDVSSAQTFLAALDPTGGSFAFATFPDSKGAPSSLARREHIKIDTPLDRLMQRNEAGAGVFVTVNQTDGVGFGNANIVRIRAVFVDLDGAPLAPVLDAPLTPHIVVESSPGRWHAYWLIRDLPVTEFKRVQQRLAATFGGDTAVCDPARVMRLPGFEHRKAESFVTRIEHIDTETPPYDAVALVRAFELAPEDTRALPKSAGIISGERNTTLTSIAGRLRRAGRSEAEITDSLLEVNRLRCSPPIDDHEVFAISASVGRYPPATTSLASQLTDVGNAERFVRICGPDIRYVGQTRTWLIWSEGRWKADTQSSIVERAKDVAKRMLSEAELEPNEPVRVALHRHALKSMSAPRLRAMLELATSDPQIVVDHRQLDLNDYELSVENGIVNLRTGAFRHRTREDLVTQEAGTNFDASAACPRFMAFLDQVTGGDVAVQEYLQRWMGYVLTGATTEHAFAFFHGAGANGKSTFIDIARRLLGSYATSAQPDTFMARRTGGGPSSDIARLAGKRLVISNEIRDGAQFEENLLKQLVGGDEVVAREMYASEFVFRPKLKLFIAGNHLPVIRGDDEGIWRRVQFVPFVQTIPEAERDKHLVDKLVAELPGILNWAIQGCLTWQKVGLHPPAGIRSATDDYRQEMDILARWLGDECEVRVGLRTAARDLYSSYRQWCDRNGLVSMSEPAFARKLEARGFARVRSRAGNLRDGISLKIALSTAA